MSVAAVLPALSLEACPRIAPVPQSKLTTERHGGEDQQMVVVYRQDNDGCGDTWCQVWAALVHNSDRGRELAWPRLPSSDHLAIRHPERRHGVQNLAPDPCLDSLCRQPSRSHR